jgi:hypothetical protein
MVSYLGQSQYTSVDVSQFNAYPSFGSLIDFKLMYSSYSNVPMPTSVTFQVVIGVHTVELGVVSVEVELCDQVINVFRDQRAVSWKLSAAPGVCVDQLRHTLHAITTCDATRQTFEPADMCLSLFQNNGVSFLQNLVDGDESLEGLDLVGHDGLTGTWTQYDCETFGQ